MTRRSAVFVMPLIALGRPATKPSGLSPYNRVVSAANAFDVAYVAWAKAMNSAPGMMNAKAAGSMDDLRPLWRELEKSWLVWMRGL